MLGPFVLSVLRDPLTLFILAVVLGVLGLVLLVVYWNDLGLDRRISTWPSVPGKITVSHVHKGQYSTPNGARTLLEVRYVPKVDYTYSVMGTSYHGERIGNSVYSGMTSRAPSRVVKRFPVGAAVTVYYDPSDPGQAVLEKTMLANIIGLIVGIVLCIAALFLAGMWIVRLLPGH